MKKICFLLLLGLLAACDVYEPLPAAEQPQAGAPAPALECGSEEPEPAAEEGVGVIKQAATACVGRPSNRKLLSTSCTTCPLIWIYPYQSSLHIQQMRDAAAVWNNALGWNVVGVDDQSWSSLDDIPTYGLVMMRNGNYDLPGTPCQLTTFTAGDHQRHSYPCYRDRIRIVPDTCVPDWAIKHVMAHEIGHALLRGFTNDADTVGDHDINHTNSVMAAPSNFSMTITPAHRAYLNQVRRWIVSGQMDQPCAFRDLGCL